MKNVQFLILSVFLIIGCSRTHEKYSSQSQDSTGGQYSDYTNNSEKMPWVVWDIGADLEGRLLNIPSAERGDIFFREGLYLEARDKYQRAQQVAYTPAQREALFYRVQAVLLAEGKGSEVLEGMSNFFKLQGVKAQDVSGIGALYLGFAYKQVNDIDQSLAWLVRAHSSRQSPRGVVASSERGILGILEPMTDSELNDLGQVWGSERVVSALLGKVQKNRQYSEVSVVSTGQERSDLKSVGEKIEVAAMLPLSGKYKSLGTHAKQGMKLAEKQSIDTGISVLYIDSQDKEVDPVIALTSLIQERNVSALVGPLLSDVAFTVMKEVKAVGLPAVHLSKRKEFDTASTIVGLGFSISSQINSLLAALEKTGKVKKLAVVYGSNAVGRANADEFVRYAQVYGMPPVLVKEYDSSDVEGVSAVAQEVELTGADTVFFAAPPHEAIQIMAGYTPEYRKNVQVVGLGSWYNPSRLQQFGRALNGAIFVAPFFSGSQRKEVRDFISLYQSRFKEEPDFLAAQGFDALQVVSLAYSTSRSMNVSFVEGMSSFSPYKGLTGIIRPTSNGTLERMFKVVRYIDGTFEELN